MLLCGSRFIANACLTQASTSYFVNNIRCSSDAPKKSPKKEFEAKKIKYDYGKVLGYRDPWGFSVENLQNVPGLDDYDVPLIDRIKIARKRIVADAKVQFLV